MQHSFISGILATVGDDELALEATKTMARVALGGRERRMLFADIVAVELREPKALTNGTLLVATEAGRSDLHFPAKERDAVRQFHATLLEKIRANVAVKVTQKTWVNGAEKVDEDRARRAEVKAQAKEAAIARIERDDEKYGARIASEVFANYIVDIYANGYVAYGLAHHGKPRKLVAVSAETEVTKKTGLGRAVGAVLTTGVNLVSPNMRGDAYLTIVTEDGVKKLHESPPRSMSIKAMYAIEAAGKAVIEAARDKR